MTFVQQQIYVIQSSCYNIHVDNSILESFLEQAKLLYDIHYLSKVEVLPKVSFGAKRASLWAEAGRQFGERCVPDNVFTIAGPEQFWPCRDSRFPYGLRAERGYRMEVRGRI